MHEPRGSWWSDNAVDSHLAGVGRRPSSIFNSSRNHGLNSSLPMNHWHSALPVHVLSIHPPAVLLYFLGSTVLDAWCQLHGRQEVCCILANCQWFFPDGPPGTLLRLEQRIQMLKLNEHISAAKGCLRTALLNLVYTPRVLRPRPARKCYPSSLLMLGEHPEKGVQIVAH